MKRILLFMIMGFAIYGHSQNIGIGTSSPKARLHVTDSSVLFSATGGIPASPHNVPVSGSGRRFLWYPDKAAFRVGYIFDNNWDKDSIGNYSFACGYGTKAKGESATAMGEQSMAFGRASLAIGQSCKANADYSVALGFGSVASNLGSVALLAANASGSTSIAIGNGANATADFSTAIGASVIASGEYSCALGTNATAAGSSGTAIGTNSFSSGSGAVAIGNNSQATGNYALALGSSVIANSDHSVALGYSVYTNGHAGAFFFGDSDPNNRGVRSIGSNDQFATRFNGGYYFITSDFNGTDIGVKALAGQNSWSAISDVRLKENFLAVDGESVLEKISKFNLTTWNYKGQSPNAFRHYGPMAQDFFAAFGKDDLGTIGCDTLINQQDFLGVSLIGIQALEKRTTELRAAIDSANATIVEMKKEIQELKEQNKKLLETLSDKNR